MTARECKLTLIQATRRKSACKALTVLDLSYGGVRFRGSREFLEGEVYTLRVGMPRPMRGVVTVKAQVRWVRPLEARGNEVGAEFLKSSKGWLGPEDNSID